MRIRMRMVGRGITAPRVLRQLPREVRRQLKRPKRRRSMARAADIFSMPFGRSAVGAFWQ